MWGLTSLFFWPMKSFRSLPVAAAPAHALFRRQSLVLPPASPRPVLKDELHGTRCTVWYYFCPISATCFCFFTRAGHLVSPGDYFYGSFTGGVEGIVIKNVPSPVLTTGWKDHGGKKRRGAGGVEEKIPEVCSTSPSVVSEIKKTSHSLLLWINSWECFIAVWMLCYFKGPISHPFSDKHFSSWSRLTLINPRYRFSENSIFILLFTAWVLVSC